MWNPKERHYPAGLRATTSTTSSTARSTTPTHAHSRLPMRGSLRRRHSPAITCWNLRELTPGPLPEHHPALSTPRGSPRRPRHTSHNNTRYSPPFRGPDTTTPRTFIPPARWIMRTCRPRCRPAGPSRPRGYLRRLSSTRVRNDRLRRCPPLLSPSRHTPHRRPTKNRAPKSLSRPGSTRSTSQTPNARACPRYTLGPRPAS